MNEEMFNELSVIGALMVKGIITNELYLELKNKIVDHWIDDYCLEKERKEKSINEY